MLAAIDRVLAPVTWLVGGVRGRRAADRAGARRARRSRRPTPQQAEATAASGKEIFTTTCGGCHTLADAGTSGATGPNLDEAAPDAATVKAYVRGGGGGMPSFGDSLSNAEIDAVAAYVSSAAGG